MISVKEEGKELKITFDYSKESIIKTKKLKGYHWEPAQKAWFVSNTHDNLTDLEKLFGYEIYVNELFNKRTNRQEDSHLREELILKGYS